MIETIRRQVEAWLRDTGRTDIDPHRYFCLDDSKGPVRGCFLLFFGVGGDVPLVVAKGAPVDRARMREGRSVYEVDFENLSTLERIGMNEERRTTPEPLGKWNDGEVVVTLQSALEGELLKNIPGSEVFSVDRAAATVRSVMDWWRLFQQRHGVERRAMTEDRYAEDVLGQVHRFRRLFQLDDREREFLDRRFERERRLADDALPYMAAHGDFCTANVMDVGGKTAVFDWEFPLRRRFPLFDLFHFFASTRFPFRGRRGESRHIDSFKATFWGDSYYSHIVRDTILAVCDEHRISRERIADLFVLSLIHIANLKFEALVEVYGIDEEAGSDEVPALWDELGGPDKDVPFACIRDGVSENLRHVVRQGFPSWFEARSPSK